MTVNDVLEKNLERYVLPLLRQAAPVRSGRLKRSLGVKQIGGKVVVGAVNEPYTKGQGPRHPGVYGYILNQGHSGTRRGRTINRRTRKIRVRQHEHVGWLTKVTTGRAMKRALRNAAREALPIYLRHFPIYPLLNKLPTRNKRAS